MANYSTNEFRSGLRIIIDNDPCVIVDNEFVKPGKGQAFNRVRIKNLKTGKTVDKTFKSGESVEAAGEGFSPFPPHPPQPADDVADVAAEHAAEHVELIDHDVVQPLEKGGPLAVVGEQPVVHHLGVGQDHVGVGPGPRPLLPGGVAVIGRGLQPGDVELPEGPELILSQRVMFLE